MDILLRRAEQLGHRLTGPVAGSEPSRAAPGGSRAYHCPGQHAGAQLQRQPNPTLRAAPTVIQRAGHAEDLLFISGSEWIIKRADATEASEYESFASHPEIAPPNVPRFYGPFADKSALLEAATGLDIAFVSSELEKLDTMATELGARRLFILSSAKRGSPGADLKDLKLGKYTASGTDQKRRGVGFFARQAKITMHNAMDLASGSRERGFRDEDQWQNTPASQKAVAASINLGPFEDMLKGSNLEALGAIFVDLDKIKGWLTRTTKVYVGMSVLVVSNPDSPQESNATTIDFEHPITIADDSFGTHQAGMIAGIANIAAMVEQEGKKKKAEDSAEPSESGSMETFYDQL